MAKIVFVSPNFWPEKIGSAPYCTDLAVWLAQAGHEVKAVAFRPHYPSAAEFTDWQDGSRDNERVGDVAIVRVPTVRSRGSGGMASRVMNDVRFLANLLRLAFAKDFSGTDAIFAFVPSSLSLFGARLLAARTGARLIGVVHDIESGLAGSLGIAGSHLALRGIQLVEGAALNLPDELVVLTQGMQDELRRLKCTRPIRVMPLWCNEPVEDEVEPGPKFTVSYSGNFGKKQNLDQLLPVFAMLQTKLPDVEVHLRGDGSERQRLERAIVAQGWRNTTFHPLVPNDQLIATIQSAHVHLVPQAPNIGNYAIPSKVYSILSAGRPFICIAEADTELAALAETSGAGICVEPNNPVAVFAAIEGLVNDRDRVRAMGANAKNYVRSKLNRTKIFEEYASLMKPSASAPETLRTASTPIR
ncbi:MAG: glycosyltransferase family 4 protein [Hyphomicrobium sp.]|nr:glycosyltransferase family 4 protein [Hyphomicrobium sp.]